MDMACVTVYVTNVVGAAAVGNVLERRQVVVVVRREGERMCRRREVE